MAERLDLSGFLPLLRRLPDYGKLLVRLAEGAPQTGPRFPLLDAAKPLLLAGLHCDLGRPVLVLTPEAPRARQLAEQIALYSGDHEQIAFFPEPDALFRDVYAPTGEGA